MRTCVRGSWGRRYSRHTSSITRERTQTSNVHFPPWRAAFHQWLSLGEPRVGHSWGGAVITQAGDSAKVTGLVYVAAFQPDVGESVLTWAMKAPPAPENGILPPDEAGYIYYDKAKFHAGFAANLSAEKAASMYDGWLDGGVPVENLDKVGSLVEAARKLGEEAAG